MEDVPGALFYWSLSLKGVPSVENWGLGNWGIGNWELKIAYVCMCVMPNK